jgi:hypothetical protein
MARPTDVGTERLSDADREALDSIAGSARLEGVEIPESHEELAAVYLAGEIDEATYQARIESLIVKDFGPGA